MGWHELNSRLSSASTEEEFCSGFAAMVAFKWEAAPGKPHPEPRSVSKHNSQVLDHPHLPLPPCRKTQDDVYSNGGHEPGQTIKSWGSSAINAPSFASCNMRKDVQRVCDSLADSAGMQIGATGNEGISFGNIPARRLEDGQSLGRAGPVSDYNPERVPGRGNPLRTLGDIAGSRSNSMEFEKYKTASEISEVSPSCKDEYLGNILRSIECDAKTCNSRGHVRGFVQIEEQPLPLPPGKGPRDGFYLQYPRPVGLPKTPASEMLKSSRFLVQKRLKNLLGLHTRPSFSKARKPSSMTYGDAKNGEAEEIRMPPLSLFDPPRRDVAGIRSGQGLSARLARRLEKLQRKPSSLAKCFPSDDFSKATGARNETDQFWKSGESDHSAFQVFNFSDYGTEVDNHSLHTTPGNKSHKRSSNLASRCWSCESSHSGHHGCTGIRFYEDGVADSEPVTSTNSSFSGPSHTSSPDSYNRGARHYRQGLFTCFSSSGRKHPPSCELMATILMSLCPSEDDESDDVRSNVVDRGRDCPRDEEIRRSISTDSSARSSMEKSPEAHRVKLDSSLWRLFQEEEVADPSVIPMMEKAPQSHRRDLADDILHLIQEAQLSKINPGEPLIMEDCNSATPAQLPEAKSVLTKDHQKFIVSKSVATQLNATGNLSNSGISSPRDDSVTSCSRRTSMRSRLDQQYSAISSKIDDETGLRNSNIVKSTSEKARKAGRELGTGTVNCAGDSAFQTKSTSWKLSSLPDLGQPSSLGRSLATRSEVFSKSTAADTRPRSSPVKEFPATTMVSSIMPQTKETPKIVGGRNSSEKIQLQPSLLCTALIQDRHAQRRPSASRSIDDQGHRPHSQVSIEAMERTPTSWMEILKHPATWLKSPAVTDSKLEDDKVRSSDEEEEEDESLSTYDSHTHSGMHILPDTTPTFPLHFVPARKPATWVVSEETFRSSPLVRYKLHHQQTNESPRSSFVVDDIAQLTDRVDPSKPISDHMIGRTVQRSTSRRSLRPKDNQLIHPTDSEGPPIEFKIPVSNSHVKRMVAQWEGNSGRVRSCTTKSSAPLSWTSRRAIT